jgi:hypothetical protein
MDYVAELRWMLDEPNEKPAETVESPDNVDHRAQ